MKRCKSIQRAMKRGHLVSFVNYAIVNSRPFNNRKNTSKRKGVNSRNNE